MESYNLMSNEEKYAKNRFQRYLITFGIIFLIFIPVVSLFTLNFLVINNENNVYVSDNKTRFALIEDFVLKNRVYSRKEEPLKFVCYYNYPNESNGPDLLYPKDIDCDLCTHINIAFASVKNKSIFINTALSETIKETVQLKSCNKDLKILLSVGGASSDNGFSEMVQDHASRKEFIRSIRDYLKMYKLDGIDLDWEFPGYSSELSEDTSMLKSKERQHFTQLLREIRSEYIRENRDYLLTVAVAAQEVVANIAYDIKEMNKYVDFVNLMSYDFHFYTKLTPFTGLNAPLYRKKEEEHYFSTLNVNYSSNYWADKGLERGQIVVGLPTFGHSFTLVNANNALPGSPSKGYGQTGFGGFVDYSQVCKFIEDYEGVVQKIDNETFSPFLSLKSEWMSYDDIKSLTVKTNFVKNNKFAGVMVYSLNSDDFSKKCATSLEKFFLSRQISRVLYNDE